jgi:hypothetical protein
MKKIPSSLRYWFVAHFVIDFLFAIPLLVAPMATLNFLGLEITTPEATLLARLVGAALIGIGGTSLLANKKGPESYNTLLTLKILWSNMALLAILISILEGAPDQIWGLFAIFFVFAIVWIYYKKKI